MKKTAEHPHDLIEKGRKYDELKASHERLKEAMPAVIILANLAYTPLADKKTMLECIKEDVRVLEIARSALKQAP